jgi:hypothetical protein
MVKWFGDKVRGELKKALGAGLTRAAIHLARRVKENLSTSGRQGGVEESAINRGAILRTGRDERNRRSVTVTQHEFTRIAGPRNQARRAGVRSKRR